MNSLANIVRAIRWREVLVLQGPPLMGVALAAHDARVSLAAALAPAAQLGAVSTLLVAAIWMLNDWADYRTDRGDRGDIRDDAPAVARSALLAGAGALLGASALACAGLPARTQGLAALIALHGLLYSAPPARAKGVPFAGSALHLTGGLCHFLLGASLFAPVDARAAAIALFFALVFTAGHGVQEVQDHDADRRAGIRTNAVALGPRPTFLAAGALFLAAYADLAGLCAAGLLPPAPALTALAALPLHATWSRRALASGLAHDDLQRLRTRYRALFALIGVALLGALAR